MIVRLGYACVSKTINDTCSHTVSYTNYLKETNGKEKLNSVISKNLEALENILEYNIKNNIHFFRITSSLISLATKEDVYIDYVTSFKDKYLRIGDKIKKSKMRVDFHPDEFCVINTTKKDVFESSLAILNYHYTLFEALELQEKVLVVHVGSSTFGKENSIARFKNNFNLLPEYIRECIVIENDDKVFNAKETLELCENIKRPMVLDYHHHICNGASDGICIDKYYERIFATWERKNS